MLGENFNFAPVFRDANRRCRMAPAEVPDCSPSLALEQLPCNTKKPAQPQVCVKFEIRVFRAPTARCVGHLLVPLHNPRAPGIDQRSAREEMRGSLMTALTPLSALLQAFFIDRLMNQRRASPHTIASYRDTFRLLFRFAQKQLKKPPSELALDDLSAPFIGAF